MIIRTLLALTIAFLPVATTTYAAERNVVLIISDDQGRDLGTYGNAVVRTPHIDALARRGTLFLNAFATVSSCSPSRSVIFTGLYSHSNGMYGLAHDVHNQHLLPWVQTLPQLLRANQYATALVGKKHILPNEALTFDVELAPERPGNRDVAFMVAEARKFVEAAAARPFFLVFGFSDPHRAAQNFGNTREWPAVPRETYDRKIIEVPSHLPDTPQVREDVAEYYESISRLDSGIGLLLDMLGDTGHGQDTLVIFLSDNGRPFPGAKTTLYDHGIHLPLIIASPTQRRRGVRNAAMVSWIDIAPTILEWTNTTAAPDYELPGPSLLPALERDDVAGWDRVFASHTFHEIQQYYPMRAMRTRSHKYILNLASELPFPIAGDIASSPSWRAISGARGGALGRRNLDSFLHRPREELYDLANDPGELRNLANDPEHRNVLERMRRELSAHREATKDPWVPGQASVFGHK